jgi:hypothetical protein
MFDLSNICIIWCCPTPDRAAGFTSHTPHELKAIIAAAKIADKFEAGRTPGGRGDSSKRTHDAFHCLHDGYFQRVIQTDIVGTAAVEEARKPTSRVTATCESMSEEIGWCAYLRFPLFPLTEIRGEKGGGFL